MDLRSLDLQYWACWDQPSNIEPIGCNLNKHWKLWDRHYQVYQVLPEFCTMKFYGVVLAAKRTRQLEQKDPPPKKKENICPLTWWHFPYLLKSEVTKSQLKHIQNLFLLWLFMHISWIQKSKPALAPNNSLFPGVFDFLWRYIYQSHGSYGSMTTQ